MTHNAPTTELIFLGTGTSSSLPNVNCLTQPPDGKQCKTCLSTLAPEGKKNVRRNTSAVVRIDGKDDRKITIVIDAGKTFQAAAVEWFPKFKLRRIDALLLTHAHADAMNGLDDLRGWTLGKHIQDHIDVYLTQATFGEIKRSFPYLVSKEYASGGGDVPDFVYHFIEEGVPFEIEGTGVHVTPFSVHHGRVFSVLPCPAYTPTPNETGEAALVEATKKLHVNGSDTLKPSDAPQKIVQPYFSLGFRIEDRIVYISDVSYIPESAWPIILERKDKRPLPVCVLDCLGLRRHTSHFGLDQTMEAARKIGAQRTYILGFSHAVSHDEYVTITEVLGGDTKDESSLSAIEKKGIELLGSGEAMWMRPAHDGLRVFIDERLRDETYG